MRISGAIYWGRNECVAEMDSSRTCPSISPRTLLPTLATDVSRAPVNLQRAFGPSFHLAWPLAYGRAKLDSECGAVRMQYLHRTRGTVDATRRHSRDGCNLVVRVSSSNSCFAHDAGTRFHEFVSCAVSADAATGWPTGNSLGG